MMVEYHHYGMDSGAGERRFLMNQEWRSIMEYSSEQLRALAREFCPDGITKDPVPLGNGHINDTFLFEAQGRSHVLQRINRNVFREPEKVMENFQRVTEHIRRKVAREGGDPEKETLRLNLARDGKPYTWDENGDLWRSYAFVKDTVTYERTDDPALFREAGRCFGRFHDLLDDFDASLLYETIPYFHHEPRRWQDFLRAIEENRSGRLQAAQKEVDSFLTFAALPPVLQEELETGVLPLRVTHNDTKLNNVLMDEKTGRALCVIDLDTVMPGLAAYDFGDAIRFGASTALEDETDLDKVHFSLPYYRAFAEGYLEAFGSRLNEAELLSLPMGAKLMTLEVGIRFLGDYLNGDVYFKVDYPEHNLIRARTQLKLLQEMEEHWQEMNDIVRELGKGPKKA